MASASGAEAEVDWLDAASTPTLIGDYERLNEQPIAAKSSLEFLCFTDTPGLTSASWRIVPISPTFPLDLVRSQRVLKILPEEILAEYDASLYIDNTVILKERPEVLFDEFLADSDFALPWHSYRDSVTDEFLEVLRLGLDEGPRLVEQLNHYSMTTPEIGRVGVPGPRCSQRVRRSPSGRAGRLAWRSRAHARGARGARGTVGPGRVGSARRGRARGRARGRRGAPRAGARSVAGGGAGLAGRSRGDAPIDVVAPHGPAPAPEIPQARLSPGIAATGLGTHRRAGCVLLRVDDAGGVYPRWSRDGKELYFIAPDAKLMAVPIRSTTTMLEAGEPTTLFQTRRLGGGSNVIGRSHQYDVARDGRILINVDAQASAPPITLLMNWKP